MKTSIRLFFSVATALVLASCSSPTPTEDRSPASETAHSHSHAEAHVRRSRAGVGERQAVAQQDYQSNNSFGGFWGAASTPAPRGRRGGSSAACAELEPEVQANVPMGQADCYMKLFKAEGPCSTTIPDGKAAHNPHAGFGLCSLEVDPALRRKRGPECQTISTAAEQIRCCVAINEAFGKRGSYFGPIRRGKVPKCG